ncbi:hypothetical protein [Streptomyces gardneri]|uniref:hypothetical protein n=1 Tax=Streptomyces gardneri TaxID=66892 RepID=UPI0036BC1EE7
MTEVLAAVLIGGAACGVWRLVPYPGGWSFAFAAVHQADRQDLAQARNAVSKVRGRARKEVAVEIPLACLAVQFEVARNANTTYIYLRASDGLPELAEFDGSQFSEEDVRRFSVAQ